MAKSLPLFFFRLEISLAGPADILGDSTEVFDLGRHGRLGEQPVGIHGPRTELLDVNPGHASGEHQDAFQGESAERLLGVFEDRPIGTCALQRNGH